MSSGPIDTAFIEIRPDFRNFGSDVKRGVTRELSGTGIAGDAAGGAAIGRATKDTDKLTASSNRLAQSLRGSATQASFLGANLGRAATIGGAGLAGIGVGVGLAIKGTASAAIEFESAFAGVRKTVQGSDAELEAIRGQFLELSTEIPVTTTELSAIGEAAGQLGIETAGITEFTKTVAELGVTTNLTSEQAADALARLANITQVPQSQFDNLGSTIVQLGNRTAATEAEIVEFGLRIAGAGNQIGLSTDQILSFGASLASVGLNAEAGGTAISTLFVRVASAAEKGGKALDGFAAVAGQSGEAFAEAFRDDPAEAVTAFIEGLGRIQEEGGSVFGTLDRLGLGGIRVRDALLRSAAAGDLLRTSLATGNTAWERNNALQVEAEQRFETTASGIQLMKNEVSALAIELGGGLLPGIDAAAGGIGGLAGAIRGALDALEGGDGFDTVNADLAEMADRLAEIEESRTGSGFLPPSLAAETTEIIVRLSEVAKALTDDERGFAKLADAVRTVSPEIAGVLEDGLITPLERVELQTTELGRAILKSIPRDAFIGLGAAARSNLEETRAAIQRSGPLIGAALRSAIEDGSRAAIQVAETEGAKVGVSLATSLAQAATAATARALGQGQIADEAFDRAVISGDESAQLRALKEKRQAFLDAIAKIDQIKNPSDQRVEERRKLVSDAASVTQQIAAIEQGIISDQEAAAADAEARGREAAAAIERADRAFVQGLAGNREDEENAITQAGATEALQDDLAAHIALRNVLTVQINQKASQIKDLEIRRDTLKTLREQRARVVADIANDRAGIRADAAEARQDRQDNQADALADAITIAELRGDDKGLLAALNADIAFWTRVRNTAKKGSAAQRDAIIQIETDKKRIRDLTGKSSSGGSQGGTSVLDLLTENTRLFGSIGSNIGTPGIDPLSGFDFSEGISQWLKRMDTPAQAQGRSISVRGRLDSPQRGQTGDPAIDRLVQALDDNTEATREASGNKGTSRGKNVQSPILRNDRRFWESHQARERMEAAD